eukprot:2989409-Pyramimonas_sp.AAC.1
MFWRRHSGGRARGRNLPQSRARNHVSPEILWLAFRQEGFCSSAQATTTTATARTTTGSLPRDDDKEAKRRR